MKFFSWTVLHLERCPCMILRSSGKSFLNLWGNFRCFQSLKLTEGWGEWFNTSNSSLGARCESQGAAGSLPDEAGSPSWSCANVLLFIDVQFTSVVGWRVYPEPPLWTDMIPDMFSPGIKPKTFFLKAGGRVELEHLVLSCWCLVWITEKDYVDILNHPPITDNKNILLYANSVDL